MRTPVLLMVLGITACGGGDDKPAPSSQDHRWQAGVFKAADNFAGFCESPGAQDRAGSFVDENNWLRSWSHETYLWYDEIVDRNPANYSTPDYFAQLKTTALTASGTPKDQFHFSMDTELWRQQSESGIEAGYGVQWAIISGAPPRKVTVAYTEPNSPASLASPPVMRGMQVLTIDGIDVVNAEQVDAINAALFPDNVGRVHTFTLRDTEGEVHEFSLTSALVTRSPVQSVTTVDTATGVTGYLLFNSHIATAEAALITAFEQLQAAGVTDLVLDLRYNGGGYLDIASQLAYMVAGDGRTRGKVFERLEFNAKHPDTDPVTGEDLAPLFFHRESLGFSAPRGRTLPSLNLAEVTVITGGGTCSASESVINGLRGVGVAVTQIGARTCGKPYGFYGTDNCGETYFTIQFRGVNDVGFGDYTDGFTPGAGAALGEPVPGCIVADDFSRPLGSTDEARFAAALHYQVTGVCPASPVGQAKTRVSPAEVYLPRARWQEGKFMRRQ